MVSQSKSGDVAREKSPTDSEFERMKTGIKENLNGEMRLQCKFLLLTIGELGLRAGELTHLTRDQNNHDWINLTDCVIEIPEWSPCTCGYCRKQAKTIADTDGEKSFEEAMRDRWHPKNEMAVRTVPFGYNEEIVELYKRFFDIYDGWPHSRVSVNRRVNRIVEASDIQRSKKSINPAALRARAAFFHARRGMNPLALAEMMGFSDRAALKFYQGTYVGVQQELKRVHETGSSTK